MRPKNYLISDPRFALSGSQSRLSTFSFYAVSPRRRWSISPARAVAMRFHDLDTNIAHHGDQFASNRTQFSVPPAKKCRKPSASMAEQFTLNWAGQVQAMLHQIQALVAQVKIMKNWLCLRVCWAWPRNHQERFSEPNAMIEPGAKCTTSAIDCNIWHFSSNQTYIMQLPIAEMTLALTLSALVSASICGLMIAASRDELYFHHGYISVQYCRGSRFHLLGTIL